MRAVNIPASVIKPGMTTCEDVYSPSGVLIIAANTFLDQNKIHGIRMNGIDRIRVKLADDDNYIYDKDPEEWKSVYNSKRISDFKEKYCAKVDEVTNVIKEIGNGVPVDVSSATRISRQIIKDFGSPADVINYLQFVRSLDDYTFSHSLDVSLISIIIAKWMGLSKAEIEEIGTAGLLHDIGKTKVSQKLLQKPGKLTPEEFEEVKKHTVQGFLMMDRVKGATNNIGYTALLHHEKIDGSGYPTGALDEEIPLFPKIVAIADIYDAMTSNRSYRNRRCPFEVIRDLEMQTFGKLDTEVLTVFLKNISNSYMNDYVELNTGEVCEIVFINPNRVWQPVVRAGSDYIDLAKDNKRFIKAIV
ncbi:MAG: HD-GYP domain-containing protein [Pseudomonadota bacterium]